MADDNIFQQYLRPPKSISEYAQEYDQADARRLTLKQNALELAAGQQKYDEGTQARDRAAQLRQTLMGLPVGATDDQRIQAMRGTGLPEGFAQADSLQKTIDERRKTNSAADKDDAATAQTKLAQSVALHNFQSQKLATVQSPEDALAWAEESNALGLFNQPGQYERGVAAIQAAAAQAAAGNPQAFAQWKDAAMRGGQSVTDQYKQQLDEIRQKEQVRQFGETEKRIKAEGDANRSVRSVALTHGVKGLTEEQNEALFGEGGAVTTGKLDPNRINSRTASLFADAFIRNPNTDMSKISGDIALARNATFRQKAMVAEALPEIMQSMVDAGKKLGFNNMRTVGKMQGWVKGEFNDPDMTEYMSLRNDALMTIAGVMRGNGMTDMAHKAETEVSAPTMDPAALDAWLRGQMKSLEPRLRINNRITRDKPVTPVTTAATSVGPAGKQEKPSLSDILGK